MPSTSTRFTAAFRSRVEKTCHLASRRTRGASDDKPRCRPIHRFVLFSGFTGGRKHLASRRARCSAAAARAAWLRGFSSGTTRSSFCGGRRLRMGEWICSTRAYDKA